MASGPGQSGPAAAAWFSLVLVGSFSHQATRWSHIPGTSALAAWTLHTNLREQKGCMGLDGSNDQAVKVQVHSRRCVTFSSRSGGRASRRIGVQRYIARLGQAAGRTGSPDLHPPARLADRRSLTSFFMGHSCFAAGCIFYAFFAFRRSFSPPGTRHMRDSAASITGCVEMAKGRPRAAPPPDRQACRPTCQR